MTTYPFLTFAEYKKIRDKTMIEDERQEEKELPDIHKRLKFVCHDCDAIYEPTRKTFAVRTTVDHDVFSIEITCPYCGIIEEIK